MLDKQTNLKKPIWLNITRVAVATITFSGALLLSGCATAPMEPEEESLKNEVVESDAVSKVEKSDLTSTETASGSQPAESLEKIETKIVQTEQLKTSVQPSESNESKAVESVNTAKDSEKLIQSEKKASIEKNQIEKIKTENSKDTQKVTEKNKDEHQVVSNQSNEPSSSKSAGKISNDKNPRSSAVYYECIANECSRQDLVKLILDISEKNKSLISIDKVGKIIQSEWTKLGTVLTVEWDIAGLTKSEKLVMNVPDTTHMTLKDEQGKINQYQITKPDIAQPNVSQ